MKKLKFCKKVLGDKYPEVLLSMAYLAAKYNKQGRSIKAEELDRQAIKNSKRVLGAEHPKTPRGTVTTRRRHPGSTAIGQGVGARKASNGNH